MCCADDVSVLYREPKLLKFDDRDHIRLPERLHVSVLYREPKLLKYDLSELPEGAIRVSVLYREPKLLKEEVMPMSTVRKIVSVLYREPKLLKVPDDAPIEALDWEFQCSTVSRNC